MASPPFSLIPVFGTRLKEWHTNPLDLVTIRMLAHFALVKTVNEDLTSDASNQHLLF